MRRFTLDIAIENDAFQDGAEGAFEVARIMRELANMLDERGLLDEGDVFALRDTNGNRVGAAKVEC